MEDGLEDARHEDGHDEGAARQANALERVRADGQTAHHYQFIGPNLHSSVLSSLFGTFRAYFEKYVGF